MKRILFFCLIGLTAFSCQQDHALPADTCRLAQIKAGASTQDFTYNAAGILSKWVLTTVGTNGVRDITEIVSYDFTRDATGRITSLTQIVTFDGKTQAPAVALFTYTNGLLTSTSTTVDPASPGSISRTFSYDSNNRMSKRVVVDKTAGFTSTETYEYDSRGNCTKYLYTDSSSKVELAYTYDTSKNPEQLLIKSIPFNLRSGQPWSVNTILTAKETYTYGADSDTYTGKQTELKTDAKGYVTSSTMSYDDGYVAKTMYALTGCN